MDIVVYVRYKDSQTKPFYKGYFSPLSNAISPRPLGHPTPSIVLALSAIEN
jgi:hypothetical protein